MTKSNKILMLEARDALKDKWASAIGIYFVYILISIGLGFLGDAGALVQLLVTGPLTLGISIVSLYFARGQEARLQDIFAGFNDFIRALVAYIIMSVFIILWTLLLIIPGIIAMLAYSQTFFILADDKTISAREAIRKSKALMQGNKKKLFFLGLRFVGWFLLGICTLGIGLLWIIPYYNVDVAKFYDDISGKSPEIIPAATV